MENKFTCAYCGKEWGTAVERARCEISCEAKKKEREEKERREKLLAEKEERRAALQEILGKVIKEIEQYSADYHEPVSYDFGAHNLSLKNFMHFWPWF